LATKKKLRELFDNVTDFDRVEYRIYD